MANSTAKIRLCLFFLSLSSTSFVSIILARRLSVDLNGDEWRATNLNRSVDLLTTRVPGGIYTDLQRNGYIGDPYFRNNDVNYRWVGNDTWIYWRNFFVSIDILLQQKIRLRCDGIDTVSSIKLNGHLIGKTDNMFVRYFFNVKDYLLEGNNYIEIVFESPVEYAKEKYEEFLVANYSVRPICPPPVQNGECHVNFIRKIQSQFSWDWGPAFPSVGIWKNIGIEAFNGIKINDMLFQAELGDDERWTIALKLITETCPPGSYEFTVYLNGSVQFQKEINECSEEMNFTFPVTFPLDLWWPNGFGKQALYNLTAVFVDKDFNETTSKTINVGFRTVELVQDPIENKTGLTFYFKINGQAIFMKGSNWIPADSFPERVTYNYTRRLLQSAKDAHMNVLRVWGGGMYETDEFYQLADEMGILIWQDFMFACAMYPTSDEFLSSVKQEITHQVSRLQYHPSILIWSGNNENEAALMENWYQTKSNFKIFKEGYLKLYIDTIRPLVVELDPNRPFISSSPSNGLETIKEGWLAKNPQDPLYGDVHYYIYQNNTWIPDVYPTPRFTSEYGFQSWSSFETISKVSTLEDWNWKSNFMSYRQHHPLGNIEMFTAIGMHLCFPPRCDVDESNIDACNSTEVFESMLYLTQIVHAMSLKVESEHYLRKQNVVDDLGKGLTMGAMYWQLNDIWPSPSWSTTEFGGKWKMAHYYAAKFFAPRLISPVEEDGKLKVYAVSTSFQSKVKLQMSLFLYQWSSFQPLYVCNKTFTEENQSQMIFESNMKALLSNGHCQSRAHCFLHFLLIDFDSSAVLNDNFLFLTEFTVAEGLNTPHFRLFVINESNLENGEKKFELQLTTDSIAPFVWLEATGIKGRFSDNGFLLVQQKINLEFISWEDVTISQLYSKLSVTSLQNVYSKNHFF